MGACTKGQRLSVQRILNDRLLVNLVFTWLIWNSSGKSSNNRWLQLHESELQALGVPEAPVAAKAVF